jgi:hypothetical protein
MIDKFKNLFDFDLYQELKNLNLNKLGLKTQNTNMIHDIYQQPGSEHYRLLCYISTVFDNQTLYEIGTWIGAGTTCLAYNRNNQVISYDICYNVDCEQVENIEYRIGDYKKDKNLLLSPFIFIDVDHNGTTEREIYKYLSENNYKGITMWDDINLNLQMKSFWKDVQLEKLDITKFGHYSGTGLIFFE